MLPKKLEYPDNLYNISDIPDLNIDESNALYVPEGAVVRLGLESKMAFWAKQAYDPPRTDKGFLEFADSIPIIYSQGILLSSMFMARSRDSLTVANMPPKNDRLCSELKPILKSTDSDSYLGALLIRGSLSKKPEFLWRWLDDNGLNCEEMVVETGNSHFGVVLDIESGKLSVARKTPSREVMQYSPCLFMVR